MNRTRYICAGVGAVALLGVAGAANANGVTVTNGVTQRDYATVETPPFYPTFASYDASYTNVLNPTPSVSAVASAGGTDPWIVTQADSSVDYSFTVVGPSSVQSAPVSISYSLSVSQIPIAGDTMASHVPGDALSAVAELSVTTNLLELFCNGTSCYASGSASGYHLTPNNGWEQGEYVAYVTPNQANDIYIYAAAYVEGNGYASAMVDPVIAIDPTWLANHPGYSLDISEGVGNGAAPEPATWVLMLVGMGVVGAGMRARSWRRLRTA